MKIKHLIYLFFIIIVLSVERWLITLDDINSNLSFSRFLETQLFIIYLIICYKAVKKFGVFNLFTLFIITLGLFNFMKIFYGLFFPDNYRDVMSMIPIDLNESAVQETLWVFTLFTLMITMAYWMFANKMSKKQNDEFNIENNGWAYSFDNKIFRIGRITMLLTLGLVLYRCYIEINHFSGLSFTELYKGGSQAIPIPSIIRISTVFFQVGFMMILGSRPSKRLFFIYAGLYIMSVMPYLVIGLRNAFALTVLTLLWYYIKVYDAKIKMWKIFVPAIFFIILLQITSIYRDGGEVTSALLTLIPLFLTYQSTSMYVLALYIQNRDIIIPHPYPFFLDPALGWLTGLDGQSLEVLEKRSSLGHQMVYTLSPDAYLGGMSFGTTCIAELYEFGFIGVVLGAVIMGWAIAKVNFNIKKNRYYLLLSFFFCSYMLIAPRSTFLPNIYFLLRYILAYGVIYLLWMVFKEVFRQKAMIK